MDYSKLAGWALLALGLIIIIFTLFSSYNIFTGKSSVPEIFQTPQKEISSQKGKTGGLDIESQLNQMLGEQLKGILPADTLPKVLNFAVWSMLAFVLMFGGGQISNIGIKLIKK